MFPAPAAKQNNRPRQKQNISKSDDWLKISTLIIAFVFLNS